MNDNNLHSVIENELLENPDLFNSQHAFQLLCHYTVTSSINAAHEMAQSFYVPMNTISRWLRGVSTPQVFARQAIAHHMLNIAKKGDFSISPDIKAFKPALSELFERSASDFSSRSLLCLAFHTASVYDPEVTRRVSDDAGFSHATVMRWVAGRTAPHISVMPIAIKLLGRALSP